MNISIDSNKTVLAKGTSGALRVGAVLGLSAIAVALTGTMGGHDASPTQAQPAASAIERAVPEAQFVYYIVDSQQAATSAVIGESVTAQERILAGIVAPERVVHIMDDSEAGRMTAAESMLLAQ